MVKPAEFEYDVFISYSSRDADWVRGELLTRIEKAGLKACIDFRDFGAGEYALFNMQGAVQHSRHTLLVMTPRWFASEWTLFEGVLAATRDPAALHRRLVPLQLEKSEMPEMPERAAFIAARTYVNFSDGADLDLAWRQLLTALGAPPEAEAPKEPEHDEWFLPHPYPMPPNFTGRVAERAMLSDWLNADAGHPLLSLRALGGFGKSALAWHWLTHDVDSAAWPRVVWWSFYEGDSSFDHFLAESLEYLTGGRVKPGSLPPKEAVRALLEILHTPGTLLVLDGFERVLRAFGGMDAAYRGDEASHSAIRDPKSAIGDRDCISPLAELFLYNAALHPNLESKVLLTTRLCPRVLEARGGGFLQGCREEELTQMAPADAVAFFHAQGIRGTHTEIEQACEPYGYHPLSLCLLAGLIVTDFEQPGDIAAASQLDVSGDLVQRQHHVLEAAYDRLTPERQTLLGQIACFRSAVKRDTLEALATTGTVAEGGLLQRLLSWLRRCVGAPPVRVSSEGVDASLRDLIARGLLHHDTKENRFDLHPIVRRYAYDRLAARDRTDAHTRLRDYFAAVPEPDKVTCIEDLAPVIELYHHTVRAGQFDEACTLFHDRINQAAYYQLGAYLLQIDLLRALFPDGEDHPPRLKKEIDQAWTLNELANSYSLSGQPGRAVPLFKQGNAIRERRGDKGNLAIGLANVAQQQLVIGVLQAAEANLRRSIALCREIEDEFQEAIGHQELGRLLAYRGAYAESETERATALKVFEDRGHVQGQGVTWAYGALRELLYLGSSGHSAIDNPQSAIRNPKSAISPARRALELADEMARTIHPVEHDYVRAHWLLGAAYRVAGQFGGAERHLHEALERCRRINSVDHEADILIDLARLRAATGAADEAERLAEEAERLAREALIIADRGGHVLQGADAHLELARLARARGEAAAALEHAREALRLATCDGPPDYTYHAAYTEATGLIAELEA